MIRHDFENQEEYLGPTIAEKYSSYQMLFSYGCSAIRSSLAVSRRDLSRQGIRKRPEE